MPLWAGFLIGYGGMILMVLVTIHVIEHYANEEPNEEDFSIIGVASFLWPLLIIFAPITIAVAVRWRRRHRKQSTREKLFLRYMMEHPAARFTALSGTIPGCTLKDYAPRPLAIVHEKDK